MAGGDQFVIDVAAQRTLVTGRADMALGAGQGAIVEILRIDHAQLVLGPRRFRSPTGERMLGQPFLRSAFTRFPQTPLGMSLFFPLRC